MNQYSIYWRSNKKFRTGMDEKLRDSLFRKIYPRLNGRLAWEYRDRMDRVIFDRTSTGLWSGLYFPIISALNK